jgi:hypothetical protein
VRIAGQYGINAFWEAYVNLSAQLSEYDTENFVFARTRRDRYYEAAAGVVWHVQRDWTLRPQIAYSRNQSNITIYDYDRLEISLTLRRDFR